MVAIEPSSGIVRYSAWAPNFHSRNPKTRSPTAKDETPPPIASTTPANSVPRTVTRGLANPVKTRTMRGWAARKPQSVRFTVAKRTLTSTSWSPATDWATSAMRTTSGGPYLV